MTDRNIRIWAFRYCLGRSTYAVSDAVEMLKNEWGEISKSDKELFKREIIKAKEQGQAGMDMYIKQWNEVLELDD